MPMTSVSFESEKLAHTKKPRATTHRFRDLNSDNLIRSTVRDRAKKHPNGGGWVANTAYVSESVYLSATSEVSGFACVTGDVVVQGRCCIGHRARVSGNITLKGNVVVKDNAQITQRATITGAVVVKNNAAIAGISSLRGDIVVSQLAMINSCTLSGWGVVTDSSTLINSSFIGDFLITGNATINSSTVHGRVYFCDCATITATSISNRPYNSSHFSRNKLVRTQLGFIVPVREAAGNYEVHNDAYFSTAEPKYAETFLVAGATTISGSTLDGATHFVRGANLNNSRFRVYNATAFVVDRPLLLNAEQNTNIDQIAAIQRNNEYSVTRLPNNTSAAGGHQPLAAAGTIPPAATPVFDPRGARVIRIS